MPALHDIPIELDFDEVARAHGIGDYSRLKPSLKEAVTDVFNSVYGGEIFEPAAVYETYPVTEIAENRLSIGNGATILNGSLFHHVIPGAEELIVVVCTIGRRLERQVTKFFKQGESLRGLLLDGIGSAAVSAVANHVCRLVGGQALQRNLRASSPLSPGSSAFPLTEQWQIFKLVPVEDIGVSLVESGLMVPRKSISMVIGIGPGMNARSTAGSCDRCNLSRTCRYRAHARDII